MCHISVSLRSKYISSTIHQFGHNRLIVQTKRVLSSLLLTTNTLGPAGDTLSNTLTNTLGSIAKPLSSTRDSVSQTGGHAADCVAQSTDCVA